MTRISSLFRFLWRSVRVASDLLEEVSSDPLEVFPCDVSPVAIFSFEDPPVVSLHPTPLHPSYDWGDSWGFMRTDEGQEKVSCSCWTSIPRHLQIKRRSSWLIIIFF